MDDFIDIGMWWDRVVLFIVVSASVQALKYNVVFHG